MVKTQGMPASEKNFTYLIQYILQELDDNEDRTIEH
jgi:hypothetical protein